ncbi:hypothetical protein FRC08_011923 [Ceratobasidium sp. 394]|nr:hypothetical protein FRC08_011923 [Ceratobasidium sp. 394]
MASASTAPVSEADPALCPPPVLDDLVDESVYSTPSSSQTLLATDECTPLLPKARREKPLPWYRRPSPRLLVPFALATALCRGMTLAPRVEVFTRIACDGLRIEPHTQVAALPGNNAGVSIANAFHTPLLIFTSHPSIPGEPLHLSAVTHIRHDNHTRVIDPRPWSSDECRADPAVQRGAAKLQTLMLTLTGALSALFSGFWGQFGDRHGRSSVIALSIFAMLATNLVFVLARSQSAHPAYAFLTAPRLLMLSPLIEGGLGGFPTMQAAINAYVSDATPAGTSRAKLFSRFLGISFLGVAAGPTIGSVLPYDAFWISIVLGVVNLLLVLLCLPESLTRAQREAFRASRISLALDDIKPSTGHGLLGRVRGHIRSSIKSTLGPMAILRPRKRTGQGQAVSGEDWSLTYLAISLALYLLTIAIYSVKFLYAEHVFGWGPAEVRPCHSQLAVVLISYSSPTTCPMWAPFAL